MTVEQRFDLHVSQEQFGGIGSGEILHPERHAAVDQRGLESPRSPVKTEFQREHRTPQKKVSDQQRRPHPSVIGVPDLLGKNVVAIIGDVRKPPHAPMIPGPM